MRKIQTIFAIISTLIIASISAFAQNPADETLKVKVLNKAPDLIIRKFVLVEKNDKALSVYVYNQGNETAEANRLLLTVGKINGTQVNRRKVFTVPSLENGKGVWLLVNAQSLLPNDVALSSTYFRLTVDATQIVEESSERNNNAYFPKIERPKRNSTNEPKDSEADVNVESNNSDDNLTEESEVQEDNKSNESKDSEKDKNDNAEVSDETSTEDVKNVDNSSEELENSDKDISGENTKSDEEKTNGKPSKEVKAKALIDMVDNLKVLIKPTSKSKKKP